MFNMIGNKAKSAAVAVGATSAVLAGNASASTGFDISAVLGTITEGQVAGVAVALAFGVAIWAIRGAKMVRKA